MPLLQWLRTNRQLRHSNDLLKNNLARVYEDLNIARNELKQAKVELKSNANLLRVRANINLKTKRDGLQLAYGWLRANGAPADLLSDVEAAFHGCPIMTRAPEEFADIPEQPPAIINFEQVINTLSLTA